MAKKLNKNRIRDSRLVVGLAILIVLFTRALIDFETSAHEFIEFIGYFLITLCAMGRLYATAFLGGHKNETLITYGAFSLCRNPLYFFSFLGMTGVGFVSGHLVLMVLMPAAFYIMYNYLIGREEGFLTDQFGTSYETYMASTPRFWPNFAKYNAPETVEMAPEFLKKAFMDALWWFTAFPAFELVEKLVEKGWLTPLIMVP